MIRDNNAHHGPLPAFWAAKGNATPSKHIALTRKPSGTFTSVLPTANPCFLSLAATIYTRHRSRTLFASPRITQGLRNAGTRMRA